MEETQRNIRPRGGWKAVTAVVLAVLLLTLSPVEAAPGTREETVQTVAMTEQTPRTVIPMGRAVGIKLFSEGVLVIGTSPVETARGSIDPGKSAGLKAGDIITSINTREVNTIEEVQDLLKTEGTDTLTLQVMRGEKTMQLTATPAENAQGGKQLGVWLRDSMAGIGTITYYDPESGIFGALGHGVNDVDTAMLMPLDSGSIMYASVSDVKKGTKGNPGELHGTFDVMNDLGELYANTGKGLYGTLDSDSGMNLADPIPMATREEVHRGKATILSNVEGDEVESFTVNITELFTDKVTEPKNMVIEVTDPRLLEKTGGIVQGMSGSPIVQDGKLVGAVTHVFVNDPTRGYGIFIENMLETAEHIN